MSEFNDGGLAERGGGGLANPGGPNTAGGGGGQANRSGIGLGVNSGAGWANNPYSNNRNPGGVYAGNPFAGTMRRNPVTGQPIVSQPPVRRVNPVTGQVEYVNYPVTSSPLGPLGPFAGVPNWEVYQGGGISGSMNGWDMPGSLGDGIKDESQVPGGSPNFGGIGGIGNIGDDSRMGLMSSFAADPNAPSGIMTMMGGQPGRQGPPMRPPGPMVNPGPIGPGGQPGVDPRSAQLLAFHQAMQDWKGQRPQNRNDMAAWEAWRNSRPDRPDFGRPRPRMSRPPRVAEQRPAPRPRGFQIGGDLALRHMYNR